MQIIQEFLKLLEASEPRFKVTWTGGYGEHTGKSEVHPLSWFTLGMGFEEEFRRELADLAVGEITTDGGPHDSIEVQRVADDTELSEAHLVEKVFDNDKYDWYVWTQNKPSESFDRRGGAKQIEKGMTFGLRAATSKPGTWRMVLKSKGPSIIFSITAGQAQKLIDAAVQLKD